jgi:hypothetical protein
VALIDPSAALTMRLSSELMDAQATIRRQRRRITLLAAALCAEQQASAALAEVLMVLVADEGSCGG